MSWIVIRRRSSSRMAASFRTEQEARTAMRRWHEEGYAMELVQAGAGRHRVRDFPSLDGKG